MSRLLCISLVLALAFIVILMVVILGYSGFQDPPAIYDVLSNTMLLWLCTVDRSIQVVYRPPIKSGFHSLTLPLVNSRRAMVAY